MEIYGRLVVNIYLVFIRAIPFKKLVLDHPFKNLNDLGGTPHQNNPLQNYLIGLLLILMKMESTHSILPQNRKKHMDQPPVDFWGRHLHP